MSVSNQQPNLARFRVKYKRGRHPNENPLDIQHKKLKTQSTARCKQQPEYSSGGS